MSSGNNWWLRGAQRHYSNEEDKRENANHRESLGHSRLMVDCPYATQYRLLRLETKGIQLNIAKKKLLIVWHRNVLKFKTVDFPSAAATIPCPHGSRLTTEWPWSREPSVNHLGIKRELPRLPVQHWVRLLSISQERNEKEHGTGWKLWPRSILMKAKQTHSRY